MTESTNLTKYIHIEIIEISLAYVKRDQTIKAISNHHSRRNLKPRQSQTLDTSKPQDRAGQWEWDISHMILVKMLYHGLTVALLRW